MCKGCDTGVDADFADRCRVVVHACHPGKIVSHRLGEPDRPYTWVGPEIPAPGPWAMEYNHRDRTQYLIGLESP